MKKLFFHFIILLLFISLPSVAQNQNNAGKKFRIIAFGAHPDDAELKTGGMATIWAMQGHKVKFVSMTNGDIGHFQTSGAVLANRRLQEVRKCAEIFGIETEVLDIHDGELEPTLENRKIVARLIRDWQADLVLFHRPYDYHPDHRYTGVLAQDAAIVVAAPFFTPNTPATKGNPIFMYYTDNFLKPNPSDPSIVIGIDDVAQKKWDCILAMPSQFADSHSWQGQTLPGIPEDETARRDFILNVVKGWNEEVATKYRNQLINIYGKEKGAKIKYAEAFEICQYGRQPTAAELRDLFLLNSKN